MKPCKYKKNEVLHTMRPGNFVTAQKFKSFLSLAHYEARKSSKYPKNKKTKQSSAHYEARKSSKYQKKQKKQSFAHYEARKPRKYKKKKQKPTMRPGKLINTQKDKNQKCCTLAGQETL